MNTLENLNNIFNTNKKPKSIETYPEYQLSFSNLMSMENYINNYSYESDLEKINSENDYSALRYMFNMQKVELLSLEQYYYNFNNVYSVEADGQNFLQKALEFLKTLIKKMILHFTTFLKMLTAKILLYTERSRHEFYLKFDDSKFIENVEIKALKVKNGKEFANANFHRKLIDEFIQSNIEIENNAVFSVPKQIEARINEKLYVSNKPEKISCIEYILQGFGSPKEAAAMLKDHFIVNLKRSQTYVNEYIKSLEKMLKDLDKYKDNLSQEVIDHYQKDRLYIQKLFYANHHVVIQLVKIRKTVAKALAKGCAGKLLEKIELSEEQEKELDKLKARAQGKKLEGGITIYDIDNGKDAFNIDYDRIEYLKKTYHLKNEKTVFNIPSMLAYTVSLFHFEIPLTETNKIQEIQKLIRYVYVENNDKNLQFTLFNHFKMLRNFTAFDKNLAKTDEHLNRVDKLYEFLGLKKTSTYDKTNVGIQLHQYGKAANPLEKNPKDKFLLTIQIIQDSKQIKLEPESMLYHTSSTPNLTELKPTYRPSGLRICLYTKGKVFFGIDNILDRTIKPILRSPKIFKRNKVYIYKAADVDKIRTSKILLTDPEAGGPGSGVGIVMGDDPVPVIDITDAVFAYMLELHE